MLDPSALGQGTVKLVRRTIGPPPVNPWDIVTPTEEKTTIKAAARGVSKEFIGVDVGDTVIVATDLMVICEPVDYKPGDDLEIDGNKVRILSYQKIPAAGVTSAVRFIVRT